MTHPTHMQPSRCAELIKGARRTVALTGAGISTAAGIPDFRGPSGLYVTRRYDPEKVFDIDWFRRDPWFFYEFSRDFIDLMKDTTPTYCHRFLAELERGGLLKGVVTQNIDALHREAGSRNVVELHGSYRTACCRGCGRVYQELDYNWWDRAMQGGPEGPLALCELCNGVLKPEIVFFGEPVLALEDARLLVEGCDLLLVLGSSLQVMPASLLPSLTNAATVIVNRGEVSLSPASHRFFVHADLDSYCREVALYLRLNG